MKNQEIKYIPVKDLILWTENPRDLIPAKSKNATIVNLAFENKNKKWDLKKFAKSMGERFDQSEIPIVVYNGKRPVVYDGNRRVILAMLYNKVVKFPAGKEFSLPEFEKSIPCNVCTEEVALKHILRKHSAKGSWDPLERDIFLHNHLKEPKSLFLKFEDATKIISNNPCMNQGFVKSEVLTESNLEKIGFRLEKDYIESKLKKDDAKKVLQDLIDKIENAIISTRGPKRGKVYEVLSTPIKGIIEKNKGNNWQTLILPKSDKTFSTNVKLTKRSADKHPQLFGGKFSLKKGTVNDLYRDINDLYLFYIKESDNLSKTFPGIIRMSLRLICETAADSLGQRINEYVHVNYKTAFNSFDKKQRTAFHSYGIAKEDDFIKNLQIGAHNYTASSNLQQTIAISQLLGIMLKNTNGISTKNS